MIFTQNTPQTRGGRNFLTLSYYWNANYYILHELLANRTNFFAQCGGEHHNLLSVRGVAENFLYILAHIYKK
jgi:hypothetical protein